MELYKKHRPQQLNRVVGQDAAVATIRKYLEEGNLPHTLMIVGGSGLGKTSIARIIKKELGCGDMDFEEVNCADLRGIDSARDIIKRMSFAPVSGKCRIWLLDELHQITGDAQNAFLKAFEDTPDHVYFILCTTDPQKIIKTIKTRCTEIALNPLSIEDITKLLKRVCRKEDKEVSEDVIDKIAENCDGSARMALVQLDKVINLPEEEALASVESMESKDAEVIELCRNLLDGNGLAGFKKAASTLKKIKAEPESIRYAVLGYAKSVLLSGRNTDRAYEIIVAFRDNFYDAKMAGVAAACYEVFAAE